MLECLRRSGEDTGGGDAGAGLNVCVWRGRTGGGGGGCWWRVMDDVFGTCMGW